MVFYDRELIDCEKVVVFGGFPIDQPELFAFGFAVALIFDGDAFGEVAVEDFVIADEIGAIDVLEFALGLGAGFGRNVGIEPIDRIL